MHPGRNQAEDEHIRIAKSSEGFCQEGVADGKLNGGVEQDFLSRPVGG